MTGMVNRQGTDTVEELALPARTVVGLRERIAVTEVAELFQRAIPTVIAEFARLGLTPAGPPTAVYHHQSGRTFDITVGFPVEHPAPAPAGFLAVDELPAGPAVRVMHAGSYETLPVAYAALGRWFGAHDVTPPDVMWEEYLTGPGATDASAYRTRVVYPLRDGTTTPEVESTPVGAGHRRGGETANAESVTGGPV